MSSVNSFGYKDLLILLFHRGLWICLNGLFGLDLYGVGGIYKFIYLFPLGFPVWWGADF